jgi:hypothetical protein
MDENDVRQNINQNFSHVEAVGLNLRMNGLSARNAIESSLNEITGRICIDILSIRRDCMPPGVRCA